MKANTLTLVCVLLLAALPSGAQIGLYGKFDYAHYKDNNADTTQWLPGAGIGIYDNFLHAGPVSAGVDFRGDFESGTTYSYRSLQAGARVALKVPVLPARPYAEALIGVGGAKYTGATAAGITTSYDSKLTYGFLGGLDWAVLPHIDWRVIEAGYTRENNGSLSDPLFTISSGIALRL